MDTCADCFFVDGRTVLGEWEECDASETDLDDSLNSGLARSSSGKAPPA